MSRQHTLDLRNGIEKAFLEMWTTLYPKQKIIKEKLIQLRFDTDSREIQRHSVTARLLKPSYGYLSEYCRFSMRFLPGCCGTIVLYYRIPSGKIPQRIIANILKMQEKAAKYAGATQMLATCLNPSADKGLYESLGWKMIDEYINHRTKNKVMMFSKIIEHEPEKPKPIPGYGAEA